MQLDADCGMPATMMLASIQPSCSTRQTTLVQRQSAKRCSHPSGVPNLLMTWGAVLSDQCSLGTAAAAFRNWRLPASTMLMHQTSTACET